MLKSTENTKKYWKLWKILKIMKNTEKWEYWKILINTKNAEKRWKILNFIMMLILPTVLGIYNPPLPVCEQRPHQLTGDN